MAMPTTPTGSALKTICPLPMVGRHKYSYFRPRGHPVARVYFNSNQPMVWVEKSKIGFQYGSYGDHFGFPVGKTLAIRQFVLRFYRQPSQPSGVMSSVVSLPNHTFTGQA